MRNLLLLLLAAAVQEAPKPATPPPKEEPAPPKTSPEAKALLLEAAKRQKTDGLVGGLAPTRFLAYFKSATLHLSENRIEVVNSTEAFALPVHGARESRMREDYTVKGERVVTGHSGRFAWSWTPGEPAREFRDREQFADDINDIDHRRRMLRLSHGVFFLGAMAEGPLRVALLPDEERTFPRGTGGPVKVDCRVLERDPDPKTGEPKIRLFLAKATLDPVAVLLPAAKEGEPSFLLTLDFFPEDVRAKREYPKGIRVPDFLELFELGKEPILRIQAAFQRLEIDPEKVPDALFEPPKGK